VSPIPLNAVQLYVKQQLSGLQLPLTAQGQLQAFISPPNPNKIDQMPLCYIWGATTSEAPRATGYQQVMYNVDLWLYWVDDADDQIADSNFPVIIDAVTSTLRALKTVTGTKFTDPQTGQQSDIISVGRKMKTDYYPVKSLNVETMMLYLARIIVQVEEWIY
jgi:hypothetical protein